VNHPIDGRAAPFAVIFDLDGVIVSTDHYHRQAWQRLADELGLPLTEAQAQATRGVDRMASLAIVLGDAAARFTDAEKVALSKRKNEMYQTLIRQISARDLLPGVHTLLGELEAASVPCAIGSASKNAAAVLEQMGIARRFAVIVTGHDFVHGKPAPDVFLTAAERLGVSPARCVVFEDAAAGIEAAHAGGMKAIGVGHPANIAAAERRIADLSEIHYADIAALMA
jgi:beta-phosphoglucomutase